jgi:hypothetical protein
MCNQTHTRGLRIRNWVIAKRVSIEKASKRQNWRDLHDIADKMKPKVKAAFIAAVQQIKDSITLKDLEAAIETGNVGRVINVFDDAGIDSKLQGVTDELQAGFAAAGKKSIEHLPKKLQSEARFDLLNGRSVAFLRDYKFNLIRSISRDTREGIRSTIIHAFEEGGHPRAQARDIMKYVGLTGRQEGAVERYYKMLVKEGRTPEQIERMTERFSQRQLKYRAETIARTETIRAANAGQTQLWLQLADDGLMERRSARKIWIVTPDDRLCPICEDIAASNEDGVPIDGGFLSEDGLIEDPPAHPNCRCATGLVFND